MKKQTFMAEDIDLMDDMPVAEESSSGKYDRLMAEQSVSRLTGMFKNWFLDYAYCKTKRNVL